MSFDGTELQTRLHVLRQKTEDSWDKRLISATIAALDRREEKRSLEEGALTEKEASSMTKTFFEGFKGEEAVNHPAHYGGDTTYEVVKVCEAWGLDKDAYLFNVVKYAGRAGKKGDALEDLKKARWYLDRKIKRLEEEGT